jgi:hypothetical protein
VSVIVPTAAELDLLAAMLAGIGTATMHLFKNPVTITAATVVGDFVEATFPGYSPQPISTWGAPTVDGSGRAVSQGPHVQFNCTYTGPAQTIYGYWIESALGRFVWCESFAAPVTVNYAEETVLVVPYSSLRSEYL